jgi:uncharacterized membrane protein (DUF485 family)
MATTASRVPRATTRAAGHIQVPRDFDWTAIERSPAFRELVSRRRRFVIPATAFFMTWYLAFVILAGYAESFMGESVYEGLTVGYVFALSQFVMVWTLGWLYLRKADREWDPLRERVVAEALELMDGARSAPATTGRARPGGTGRPAGTVPGGERA